MIRCSNCGWEGNPDSSTKCQRCNQLLTSHDEIYQKKNPKPVYNSSESDVHKADGDILFCVNCGQSVPKEALFCSHCGNKIDQDIDHAVSPKVEDRETAKTKIFENPKSLEDSVQKLIPKVENDQRKLNINSTVVDRHPFTFNSKVTVADSSVILEQVQQVAKRTLMCDGRAVASSPDVVTTGAASDERIDKQFSYRLLTVDVKLGSEQVQSSDSREIKIESSFDLSLNEGDVLLIGGLRFLVK